MKNFDKTIAAVLSKAFASVPSFDFPDCHQSDPCLLPVTYMIEASCHCTKLLPVEIARFTFPKEVNRRCCSNRQDYSQRMLANPAQPLAGTVLLWSSELPPRRAMVRLVKLVPLTGIDPVFPD